MNQLARPLPASMTADEFLDRVIDGSVQDFELVDGSLRPVSPANPGHGAIMVSVLFLIKSAVKSSGLTLRAVIDAPLIIGDKASANVRAPDLLVTSEPSRQEDKSVTDPVLLVEVLSPSNQRSTRDNVARYRTVGSVQEILVLHSRRVRAEVLRRAADGSWPAKPDVAGPGERLRLHSVCLDEPLEEAYRDSWLGPSDLRASDALREP